MPRAEATTYTWLGGQTGNDWFNALNWTPQGVPGAFDSVVLGAGTAALDANASIAGFSFYGGTLQVTHMLQVSGPATFGDGSGYTYETLSGGGVLNLSGGAVEQAYQLTVAGTLNNAAGSTFTSKGFVQGTSTQDNYIYGGGVFNNAGSFVQDAAGHTTNVSAAFNNAGSVGSMPFRVDCDGVI